MRLKDKLKTKGFWIRIVSAVIVILQAFGLKLDAPAVNEILTAVVGSRSAGHFRHRVRPSAAGGTTEDSPETDAGARSADEPDGNA